MKPLIAALTSTFALALTPTALANPPAQTQLNEPAERQMSIAEVERDVAIAKDAYSRIHPGYTRYASEAELDAAWAGIVEQAAASGGMTVGDFYLALELALTTIRCDHTKAELPKALAEARAGQPLYLPLRWELIEERALVTIPGETAGLARGDEILSIDGRSIPELVEATAKYIPVDGYTEWSRNLQISQSREFMGGAVDHFGTLLWDVPRKAVLKVRGLDGSTRTVAIDRVDHVGWTAIGRAAGQASNFKDAVSFERIGDNAGLLTVDTFVNYRAPVDPQSLYAPVFEAMRNEGRDTLILDLRRNGGGSTDASIGLAANLVPNARQFMTEFRVATLDHSPWEGLIRTWDQQALNPDPRGFIANDDGSFTLREGIIEDTGMVRPTDLVFDGRLLILTSQNNSSGSTNILAHLASRENTMTIGERTGGSAEGPTAGVLFFLTLPESEVTMRIPMFRQWNNVTSFEEGLGISPDISAPITVEAFKAGSDPALEKAIAMSATPWKSGTAASTPTQASIADFAPLEGEDWTGELEYLNYGSDQRSTIPVRMVARAIDGDAMPYGFIYPGEEHKNARERMRVSRNGSKVNGYAVIDRYADETGALVIVTQGEGRDDRKSAEIRLTYVIGENAFVTRKDVRFEGGEFFNRNEYRLTR